jgi:hypothetical protein
MIAYVDTWDIDNALFFDMPPFDFAKVAWFYVTQDLVLIVLGGWGHRVSLGRSTSI